MLMFSKEAAPEHLVPALQRRSKASRPICDQSRARWERPARVPAVSVSTVPLPFCVALLQSFVGDDRNCLAL